jgi:uncharacterized protein YaaR (DUF327 family)
MTEIDDAGKELYTDQEIEAYEEYVEDFNEMMNDHDCHNSEDDGCVCTTMKLKTIDEWYDDKLAEVLDEVADRRSE